MATGAKTEWKNIDPVQRCPRTSDFSCQMPFKLTTAYENLVSHWKPIYITSDHFSMSFSWMVASTHCILSENRMKKGLFRKKMICRLLSHPSPATQACLAHGKLAFALKTILHHFQPLLTVFSTNSNPKTLQLGRKPHEKTSTTPITARRLFSAVLAAKCM